jgi:hypothetical protein
MAEEKLALVHFMMGMEALLLKSYEDLPVRS